MPWKFRERPEKKEWHHYRSARIALVVALLLVLAGMPYAWHRYQHWAEVRQLTRAHQAYVRGDHRQALFNARGVLKRNPTNEIAKAIIERSTSALQSPEAMSWQRVRIATETGDPDRLLGVADAFVAVADFASAERALERIKPEDQNSARFHRLMAKVAASKTDIAAATAHWEKAIELDPDNDEHRLELAALQLASPQPRVQALGLSAIDKLKLKPDERLPALRLLLQDAQRCGDSARAREVAKLIVSDRESEFSDKLALLSVLSSQRPKRDEEFFAWLMQLQKIAPPSADDVFNLIGWMIDNDHALLATEWGAKLPAELATVPPVASGLAQAYVRASDWSRLKAKVEVESWGRLDYLRLAFLSLATGWLGDTKGADSAWEAALNLAKEDPGQVEKLARATQVWTLKQRSEEALWALSSSDWCPRWVMEFLWASMLERGDTAKLYEVSKLLLRTQPEDLAMRNNNVTLALLTGQNLPAAHRMAESLSRENPTHPVVASTYAFSLFRQGRTKEAAAHMNAFKPEQLGEPTVALYFGSFLAIAGETERAAPYLQMAEKAQPLPEEKALRDLSSALCRVRAADRGGDTGAANTAWEEALAAAGQQADLLELLAKTAIEWGWPARGDAALLKLAEFDRAPGWARDALWAAVLKTGDSARIFRVSRLIASAHPESVSARNNYALLALLGGREKESPRTLAATLYKENANVPEVVATYGLSLMQQGKPEEAVALLAALKPQRLKDPWMALYQGIFLAAAGKPDEAEPLLKRGSPAALFPEEKALAEVLRLALEVAPADHAGAAGAADAAWKKSLAAAEGHPDWLEMLARIALKTGAAAHADTALWKLSTEDRCPRWVLDALWEKALKTGTPGQRYKVSKLLVKADPKDLTARGNAIVLALLTNQEVDAPHRQAEAFYRQNVANAAAVGTYALSLYLQDRNDDALNLMAGLPPEHFREPRAALYYAIVLAAKQQTARAVEYLRIATKAPLLPEEQSLVEKVGLAEKLKARTSQLQPQ